MAIQTTTNRIAYTGNGVTTVFAYNFRILEQSHLVVYVNGAVSTLGTDYTVSGVDNASGGDVTFTVAPAAGASVVFVRVVPVNQLVTTENNDTVFSSVFDRAIDKLTMLVQQVSGSLSRALVLSDSDPTTGPLTLPASRVSRLLGFAANGTSVLMKRLVAGPGMSVVEDNTTGDITLSAIGLPGGGSGNVVGPASSVDNRVALFSGTTGRLLADSGIVASQGTIAMSTPFLRNRLINGSFDVWQRGTQQTTTGYGSADRWAWSYGTGGTYFVSRISSNGDTLLPEGTRFYAQLSQTVAPTTPYTLAQRVESVRTLAGQTVTISFFARRNSGTNEIRPYLTQRFGTGGSPASEVVTAAENIVPNGTWARYTTTLTLPSTTGKTLGTNGDDHLEVGLTIINSVGEGATGIIDIACVQLEPGTIATPFERREYAAELALCQRYYEGPIFAVVGGVTASGIGIYGAVNYSVVKRNIPSVVTSVPALVGSCTGFVVDQIYPNSVRVFASNGAGGSGIAAMNIYVSAEL